MAVCWQGDSRRRPEVIGTQLAGLAVCRHVELHGVDLAAAEWATHRQQLAERFHRVTGRMLHPRTSLAVAS